MPEESWRCAFPPSRQLTNRQGLMAGTSWLPFAFSLSLCRFCLKYHSYISEAFYLFGRSFSLHTSVWGHFCHLTLLPIFRFDYCLLNHLGVCRTEVLFGMVGVFWIWNDSYMPLCSHSLTVKLEEHNYLNENQILWSQFFKSSILLANGRLMQPISVVSENIIGYAVHENRSFSWKVSCSLLVKWSHRNTWSHWMSTWLSLLTFSILSLINVSRCWSYLILLNMSATICSTELQLFRHEDLKIFMSVDSHWRNPDRSYF